MPIPFEPIALQGRQYDPMSSIAKAMQFKALAQQTQAQEQDLQIKKMTLQQMQQQMGDQQAMRTASAASIATPQYTSMSPSVPMGGRTFTALPTTVQGPQESDPNLMLSALGKSAPWLVPGQQAAMDAHQAELRKQALEQQKTQSEIGKNQATTAKDAVETQQKHVELIGGAAQALLNMPDDQAAQMYPSVMQHLQAQGVDLTGVPQQFDRAHVSQVAQMAISAKDQIAQKMAADAAKQSAQQHQDQLNMQKRGQDITLRGQNMVDQRMRDSNKNMSGVSYGELPPDQQKLVDEIGVGKMAMGNLDRILTKNPGLLGAVAEKYPDFDSSKVKSYTAAYRDFTGAGKLSTQLNAGSTALRHLAQLKQINDENPVAVHNAGTAAYKAYNNLLDTVADELGTFYGEPKTNEVIAAKKSTLGGWLNRGAAIDEQAKAMGVKFDELENTWQNAAPSKAYQAQMPGYSDAAKQARAKLDPEYAKRVQTSAPQQGGGVQSTADPFAQFGGKAHQ